MVFSRRNRKQGRREADDGTDGHSATAIRLGVEEVIGTLTAVQTLQVGTLSDEVES